MKKMMIRLMKFALQLLLVCVAGVCFAQKPVQTSSGEVVLDGKPLLAVGVNYYDAVSRSLIAPVDRSYVPGLAFLERFKIPFVRVNFGGFWPADFALYRRDREAYFRVISEFLDEAARRKIGVVASVSWNYAAIPDMVGEPVSAWGDRRSKTISFMSEYASELAKRFGGRDVVWVWEFGNEMALNADLPNAAEFRPAVRLAGGTPAARSRSDDISANDVNVALSEFRLAIRRFDSRTILSAGQALPRPFAYNNSRSKSWQKDTKEQFCSVLARDNPSGYGLMSVHLYENPRQGYFGRSDFDAGEIMATVSSCASRHSQAVFVGEFGFDRRKLSAAEQLGKFNVFLDVLDRSNVPLAAFWVFDYKYQHDSFSVDRFSGFQWLSLLSEFNERRRGRSEAQPRALREHR